MRYMGSKARHAKHIVPIIMGYHDDSKVYVEPFVGGGNLFSEVPAKLKYGNDNSFYAVALLEGLSHGYIPPNIVTEETYYSVKGNPDSYDPAFVGFCEFSCSFAGKSWGGYARGVDSKGRQRNFASEQVRNLLRQSQGLENCEFTCGDYCDMFIPPYSTVYCDPPYEGTTRYKSGGFDSSKFWLWCQKLVSELGCHVFVSEYTCNINHITLWEKKVTSSLTKDTGSKGATEKLFKVIV